MGTHNNKLLFIPQGMRYSRGMKSKVSKDELAAFLAAMSSGARMTAGSPVHETMHKLSAEAQRITAKINGKFRTPEKLRRLMAELTGRDIPEDFRLFPPFYTDCGKNLHIGKGVFFNAGCHFQDQGGIWVGDGTLIGTPSSSARSTTGSRKNAAATSSPLPYGLARASGSVLAPAFSPA